MDLSAFDDPLAVKVYKNNFRGHQSSPKAQALCLRSLLSLGYSQPYHVTRLPGNLNNTDAQSSNHRDSDTTGEGVRQKVEDHYTLPPYL
jgi:hypothetical protein